ncbi:hypothetical protein AB4099_19100 [Bosea sp. 2KB_26]|uniref:hypothetical protein n=1 Tax=Bosea sp. 2KB_26 TaxID=3237475 RepID=UPI003F936EE8
MATKRYARVVDEYIVEVIELPAAIKISDVFHPDVVFEEVGRSVEAGMVRNGEGFTFPHAPEQTAGEPRQTSVVGGTPAGLELPSSRSQRATAVQAAIDKIA